MTLDQDFWSGTQESYKASPNLVNKVIKNIYLFIVYFIPDINAYFLVYIQIVQIAV